jgi:hypothetical protein
MGVVAGVNGWRGGEGLVAGDGDGDGVGTVTEKEERTRVNCGWREPMD